MHLNMAAALHLRFPPGSAAVSVSWQYCQKKSYHYFISMAFLVYLLLSLACPILHFGAAAPTTDPGEVASLLSIAKKMGFPKWNFSVDPCSEIWSSVPPYISCSCSNNSCHVTELYMSSLNLVGEIPLEIANFTRLQKLDMKKNLLSGILPIQLGQLTALTFLDVGINELSGPLPSALGNITKLENMYVGSNNFSGSLPADLGHLTLLAELHIDGNGFSGKIPTEIGELTNLQNLWMYGNQFYGQIPDVFGNMVLLEDLRIYGNDNLNGPIPLSILTLGALTSLSIGDLSNGGLIPSDYKALQKLSYLSLRHNGLSGSIPKDIGSLNQLNYLDLSFNNLTGKIPGSFSNLANLAYLFLGNNNLEGSLDDLEKIQFLRALDASNNQFSGTLPLWVTRSSLQANLLWNHLDQTNKKSRSLLATFNCLDSDSPCDQTEPGTSGGFAINCGGPTVTATSTQTTFSPDNQTVGYTSFFQNHEGTWGVSNIGFQFIYDFSTILSTTAIIKNTNDQDLYKTARGAASSLIYYGLGMVNGGYTVELHFAEIVITSDNTWKSRGRRLFDIYIQRSRVKKDFEIRAAANGSFSAIVKKFPTEVTNNVLEVHLLWSGKGTCCTPSIWTYGPLISAIRVHADFELPKQASSSLQNVFVILGPILAALFIGFVIYCVTRRTKSWKFGAFNCQDQAYLESSGLSSMEVKPHIFTYNQIRIATDDFHENNKLGEGSFGIVFKGCLPDGTMVAIKQLSCKADKGNEDFINEVATISVVQHRNLVKLLGCCIEGNRRILVLEYLENNSLLQTLLGKTMLLDWPTRFNICIGIAQGLTYLHEEARTRIVHRDIKASNILLDQNLNPKIADFGLAKLFQDDKTHISTRVAGTIGYLAPEYALQGRFNEKADVYSFGILLLEIVSGRRNIDTCLPAEKVYLIEWTWQLHEEKRIGELADESLEGNRSEREVIRTIHVALLCTQTMAEVRPKMSEALSMLTGSLDFKFNITKPAFLSDLKQSSSQPSMPLYSASSSYGGGARHTISLIEPR